MDRNYYSRLQGYLGKLIDHDDAYGYQCVDLARRWAADLGIPVGFFGGSPAVAWKSRAPFDVTRWRRIENMSSNYPKIGDMVFFAPLKNGYSHVAIAGYGCTENELVVYEQNVGYPTRWWGLGNGVK